MIDQLFLKDFKGHRDTTVRFAPLTVLVGPNGAGKTSVLELLHYLGQLHYKPFKELFSGPRAPDCLYRHAAGVMGFMLRASGRSGSDPCSLALHVLQREHEDIGPMGEELTTLDWDGIAYVGDG